MELDQRIALLEKSVGRLEKLVDGNGDSLMTKFERSMDRMSNKFAAIEAKLESLSLSQASITSQLNNDCRRLDELEEEIKKSHSSKDSFNTQLIVLLGVTLLNLILGSIKVFGG